MIKHAALKHAARLKKVSRIPPEAYVCPKPFKRSEIPVSVQLRYYVLGEVTAYRWQREVKEVGDENRYANRIQNDVSICPFCFCTLHLRWSYREDHVVVAKLQLV